MFLLFLPILPANHSQALVGADAVGRGVQPRALAASTVSVFSAMTKQTFNTSDGRSLPYRLYLPTTYDSQKTYPLLVFLHGIGERGDDNLKQISVNAGILTTIISDSNMAENCIIIAPQCPVSDKWVRFSSAEWPLTGVYDQDSMSVSWALDSTRKLIDDIRQKYRIDDKRLYITGVSMGGYGTWDMITRYPKLFAAAVPVCGGTDSSKADLIKNMPIWTFHGDKDTSVLIDGTRAMVAALKKMGSKVIYSELPGVQHNAWSSAYANPDLYEWLFAQKNEKMNGDPASHSTQSPSQNSSESTPNSSSKTVIEASSQNISSKNASASSNAVVTEQSSSSSENSSLEPSRSDTPNSKQTLTKSTVKNEKSNGHNKWISITLFIACALLIGTGVFFVFKKYRRTY